MKVTQKYILEIAELLNIDVNAEDIENLTQSFNSLIDYFEVLNKVPLENDVMDDNDDVCRLRGGDAETRIDTKKLIENSEEHEDNYVLIPNVL